MRRPFGSADGRFLSRKSLSESDLGERAPVSCLGFRGPASNATHRLRLAVRQPIVPDRLRKMPSRSTLAKCLSPLDLLKMTVSLTVSSGLPSKNARRDKDLAAQLMTEWE